MRGAAKPTRPGEASARVDWRGNAIEEYERPRIRRGEDPAALDARGRGRSMYSRGHGERRGAPSAAALLDGVHDLWREQGKEKEAQLERDEAGREALKRRNAAERPSGSTVRTAHSTGRRLDTYAEQAKAEARSGTAERGGPAHRGLRDEGGPPATYASGRHVLQL